ncbi:ATP-dependent RNA helicase DHX8 [Hondaea fermentalgiana]|uniref:RNA helicase n=1 Tax=Hondaea fermentalgiana TaxID=2315210 RepID=A0A2R5G1Z9_9STRA|nr:ATP-dependent RNA helicase DHX8 [Hondaea fermentalgiana]|eukprot:GBG24565.1 ATP-dependent RNA helicase DHX8 [Hondaea fermentalgiana]
MKRASEAERQWTSDKLHELVGFSESSAVDYVIALGKSAKSESDVVSRLHEYDFPRDERTRQFAREVMSRVKSSAPAGTSSTSSSSLSAQAPAGSSDATSRKYDLVGIDLSAGFKADDTKERRRKHHRDKEKKHKRSKKSKRKDKDEHRDGKEDHSREDRKRERKRARQEHNHAPSADGFLEEDLPVVIPGQDEDEDEDVDNDDNVDVNGNDDDDDDDDDIKSENGKKETGNNDGEDDQNNETEHQRKLREFQEFVGTGEDGKEEGERMKQRAAQKEREKHELKLRQIRDEGERLRNEFTIEELRDESRFAYLKKREERELKLLQASIQDEEDLFQGQEMTEKEKRDLEVRKELKNLIESRKDIERKTQDQLYKLPDAYEDDRGRVDAKKREALLTQRYEDEGRMKTDQEVWEEQQTKLAASQGKYGVAAIGGPYEDPYDVLLAGGVDFVSGKSLKGTKREQAASEKRSGKTTQIPQYIHEAGYSALGKIGCTQPRRVAAMSVAARVAQEMNVKLGREVGYSIRFEDNTSEGTLIKYMTDGMLLREFMTSPDLGDYSAMMIDEAHERGLNTDILFGLIKDIARHRKDLRIIVASATLDAQKFAAYFDNAPIFNIPGRRYPVDIMHTKAPEADYLDAAVVTTLQIHISEPTPGDILIFLTGQEEIEAAREMLVQRTRGLGSRIKELIVCPIYASLPSEEQAKVFVPAPPGARKVVLATNIAETSLTIDGICYVIDTGFCKQTSYDARSGMDSLMVTPISQAGAQQRAGRAGRTAPGKCFRLYTEWSFKHELEETTQPEIQRSNLASVVLMLKSLGIHDLVGFDFMDPPPPEALIRCLQQLYALGALTDKGELTKVGRRMAEFPADPMLSKMLLAAERYGCVEEALTVAAMLDVNASVFYRPPDKAVHADTARKTFAQGDGAWGDHMVLKAVYDQWAAANYSAGWCYENFVQVRSMRRARDVRDQLADLCDRIELERSSDSDSELVRKAITSGYFFHSAKLQKDGSFKTVKDQLSVHVHPSSSLHKRDPLPKLVVYHQLQRTKREYMRQILVIKPEWLLEIAPHFYTQRDIDEMMRVNKPRTNVTSAVLQAKGGASERYVLDKKT